MSQTPPVCGLAFRLLSLGKGANLHLTKVEPPLMGLELKSSHHLSFLLSSVAFYRLPLKAPVSSGSM